MSDSLRFFDGQPYTRKEHLETFTIGDKIGCGVEHIGDSVQVYFNKNGAAVSESGWTSRFLIYTHTQRLLPQHIAISNNREHSLSFS